jgi:hypothetical protein
MKKNKPVDWWNKTFFILYIPYFITLFIVSTLATKKVSFLFINSAYSSFFDVFFTIISYRGDGLFIILLSLLIFFLKQKKLAVGLMLSYTNVIYIICQYFINLIPNAFGSKCRWYQINSTMRP